MPQGGDILAKPVVIPASGDEILGVQSGAVVQFSVDDFATAAQGSTADTATQPGDDADTLGSGDATDGQVLTSDGAGNSAWEDAGGGGGGTVQAGAGNLGIRATDEGLTAGNARGTYSVDLQTKRTFGSQVASGTYSNIGGGIYNTASGTFSSVGGGSINIASGGGSRVGGGRQNTASGNYSHAGGGFQNTASGSYSHVGGGKYNTASGDYSHAGGFRAKATHTGSFVFSDSTYADVNSSTTNEMTLRFANGVRILGKFGLNKTAVGTQSAITAPTGGAVIDAESRTAINTIRTVLTAFGLTS